MESSESTLCSFSQYNIRDENGALECWQYYLDYPKKKKKSLLLFDKRKMKKYI
jgi:hypothetical protein